jgi:CPA1 family monovalent cation:H+ antiporter
VSLFHVIAVILTVVALFGYLNSRLLKLPEPIGITAVGLAGTIAIAVAGLLFPSIAEWAKTAIQNVDFPAVVFQGMLGLLLFAGSLHVDWSDIGSEKWPIVLLATVGVVLSTATVAVAMFYGGRAFGFPLPFVHCLLFGALISPTDPIAVLGLLRNLKVSKILETKIAGESLFNDGTGVVLFIAILGLATGGEEVSPSEVASLLAIEVGGGILIGLAIGGVGLFLLKGVDSYAVEILITLSMATGGYAVAQALHTSGPIAVVMMGLLIGNQGRRYAMSDRTREHLFSFWGLIDELLNLVLFGLIGLEFIALQPEWQSIVPALVAIPVVLLARWVAVGVPVYILGRFRTFAPHTVAIMTWGGLRGGISVALALSLPASAGRETILAATYGVVIFSLLVQALTLPRLVRHLEERR